MDLKMLTELKKENEKLKTENSQQKEVIRQLKGLVGMLENSINIELSKMGLN